MRTIRFRGKKLSNGLWSYGSLVVSEELNAAIYFQVGKGSIKQMEWVYVNPDSVGQFVGVQDIHGNDIYEGDIMRDIQRKTIVGVVTFKNCSFGIVDEPDGLLFQIRPYYEVAGNIYDNPELINFKI